MRATLLVLAVLATGCDDPRDWNADPDAPVACSKAPTFNATVLGPPANTVVTGEVTVRGTIESPNDVTIYRVEIGGQLAMSDAFDFAAWSTKIPLDSLLDLADATGSVALAATAITNCTGDNEQVALGATNAFHVAPPSADLKIDIYYPEGDNLPADGSASAFVTVSAAPNTAGIPVSITSSSGTFGAPLTPLSGDGTARAASTTTFMSTKAGTAVLVATLANQSKAATVAVVGAPLFTPAGAVLRAHESIGVTVFGGHGVECFADETTAFTVTSGPIDLLATPGATDVDHDGNVDLVVTAAPSVASPTSTKVHCRDRYGQEGTATFTAVP